jgi:hypothetical protein
MNRSILSSTTRWNDVPRGMMDETSSHVCLDQRTARPPKRLFHFAFEPHDRRGHGAVSVEKHESVGDSDTAVTDGLKALDPTGRLEKQIWQRI